MAKVGRPQRDETPVCIAQGQWPQVLLNIVTWRTKIREEAGLV
jgi:hypothetical protein